MILAGGGWFIPHPGWGAGLGWDGLFRWVAGPEVGDQTALDAQPPALVLGAGVVHRDDVAVGEDHASASGTSSNRSTSTSPRSVIFRLGITDRARNESSWKGASIVQPS